MSYFWEKSNHNLASVELIDASASIKLSFIEFESIIDKFLILFNFKKKSLITLICDNNPINICCYIAALRSGHAIQLINSSTDSNLIQEILNIYKPELIIYPSLTHFTLDNYFQVATDLTNLNILKRESEVVENVYSETALLLSTSGTTGSPKFVRLSYKNIQANADSIAEYLEITNNEKAITSLPMSYSFGLSVINSHLLTGGKIVCTNESFAQKGFWNTLNEFQCTSFAGVPYNYYMLEKLRFGRMNLPSLRTITQAGGRLSPDKIELFSNIAKEKDYRFFVMYGQTEATARISYVPYQKLNDKIGSVGIAIPNGKIEIINYGASSLPNNIGEVVYTGHNVMLGYAESRQCLSKEDELKGVLKTGDLGYLDNDGYLYITGRTKRFIKILGQRINLDDVEKMLEMKLSTVVGCLPNDDELNIVVESSDTLDNINVKSIISEIYGIHHSLVNIHYIEKLPVSSSGKKDYKAMKELINNGNS